MDLRRPWLPSTRNLASLRIGGLAWGLGLALILGGTFWARLGTVRASLPLRLNGSVAEVPTGNGSRPYHLPGFRIRLESLVYGPQDRLRVYVGPESIPQVLEAREGLKSRVGSTGFRYEIERVLPHALDQTQLRENPAAPEDPALRVMLGVGAPEPLIGTLFAAPEQGQRREEPGGRFAVLFHRTWSPELLAALKPHPPTAEVLRLAYMGREVDHPIKVGDTQDQPPFRFKVQQVYPDFIVRPNGQGLPEPTSKSSAPLDPWLELIFASPDTGECRVLLSALRPEITDSLNAPNLPAGLTLRYLRLGEERQRRFVVFTQEDRQVRLVEQGSLRRMEPWRVNRPFIVAPGLSVTPLQAFTHAEQVPAFIAHPEPQASGQFAHPALRLKVMDGKGRQEAIWLAADGPEQTLFGGGLRVAFGAGAVTPSDFTAILSVVDAAGRELARKKIGPKDPLVYAGHRFSIAPQLPSELGTIGVQVVRERSLGPIYLGCFLLLLGTGWGLLVGPRFNRRAQQPVRVELV